MPYRFLEHTADVRVECRGKSFAELLEAAAKSLYAVAFYEIQPRQDVERRVAVSADGPDAPVESLLVQWLQELIFLMDVERFVGTVFRFEAADPRAVSAVVRGYHYLPEERETEVKAATYHGIQVRQENGGFVAEVIFDV